MFESDWPEDARRDLLIGDWHLYQRKGGHRTSTDDLITAWMASKNNPDPVDRYLDLGCGIGSVLLMFCHKNKPNVCFGIEAQTQSFKMATQSVKELPEHNINIELICSDFRHFNRDIGAFDVITGSPPYFALTDGVLPKDSQRRDCRFESRGGVEDYLQKAETMLKRTGRFYVVFPGNQEHRLLKALKASELSLNSKVVFVLKEGNVDNKLGVYELSFSSKETVSSKQVVVRSIDGDLTSDYLQVRKDLGLT